MASELGNQLLARVQDEMARNIATIKRQLIEWLERPESGGVEALREHMAEISGGLSLMGQTEAVALAEAIVAGVEALNQSVSEQGVNAAFAEKGAEIASGLLVLADYIERLDHISDNHKQSVAQATAAVKGLADGGEKIQVTTQPFISRETYQALANEVNTVIETSRNQIEQHIRNLDAPFNAENIIAQNEGLIQIFAILTLKTPQLLLQQANQMLAKDLSYAEWIEVAEALILVQETLKQLPETQTAPTANNYADAVQVQVAHSRQLEIEKLIRDTGKQGKGFFESLRKEVLQVETVKQEQPWADAAKQLVHYSSVTALVGLKELATPLQQLGLLFAEFTAQNDATLAQTYVPVIDALVAVEYLFNDLAEAGKISVQDIAFLTEAVGKIEKICPVSGKAKALFVELANSMPTESEDDVENTGDIQEFKDALGAGLEVLADDFSVLEQEEETPEEEDLPEPTPVVLASHDTVSAAPKLAMGLAQSSAAGDNAISVRAGDDAAAPAVAPGAPASTQAATPSPAPTVQPPVVSAETAAPQSDATTATEAPTTPEAIAPQEATVPADDAALAAEEPAAAEVAPEEPAAPETHEPEAAAEDTSALEVADEASAESAVEPAAVALDEPPSAPASVPAAASTQGAPVGIAYFANKSLSDLERFDVPAEKMTFMGSHADAVMDEEIREFFNEELGEIVATMNEVYPQWRENPDDAQHTTDIRRAFHTLKGSGRTVGYEALGEFAWQHEQLLNRVIEKDFAANSLVRDTVGDAISLLNVLQAQDEFVEHKGALLQQALVAERVRLSLLDAPQSEQQALDALSRQLRLSDGAAPATGAAATVSVAETASSAVDDEWAAFDDIALVDETTSAASEAPAITLTSETAEPAPEETAADMSAAPQDEAPAITLAADDFTFSDSAVEPAAHETVAPASADAVAHERQEEPASIAAPAAAASDFAGQEGYDKALRTLQRGLRMGEPDADMQAALAETIRRQWQQSVADDPALREAMAQSLLASFQNEGGTQVQWVADILAQANAAGDTAVPIQPGLTAPAAPGLPPHETPHGISEQAYNRMLSTLRRGLATGADEDMQAVLSDSISRQWLQQGIATEGETRDDIIAHLKAALASEGAVDENVLDAMLAHVPQRVPNVLPEGVRQDSYGVMMETLRASLDNANSAEVQEMLATAIGNQWQNQNSLQDSAIRAAVAEQMAAVLGGNGHDNAALVEAVLNRAAEKARQAPAGLDKADYDQLLETLRDRIGEAQDAAAQEALAARISSQLHADNHLQDEATRDAIAQRVIAALGGAGETDAAAVEAILSRVAEKVAEQTPVPAALPVGVRPESYGAMLQTLSGGLAAAQGDEHAAEALAATIGAQWQEQHSLQDADTRAAVAQQISAALGGETDAATVEGILNRAAVQAAALPAGVKHEAYGAMLQTLRAGIGAASGDEAAAEALAATIGAQWQEQHSLQDADTRAAVAQQISAALGGETDAATVEGILNRAAVQAAALPAGVKHEAYGEMLQTLHAELAGVQGDEAAAESLATLIAAQWEEPHSLQDSAARAAVAQQISAALGGKADVAAVEDILHRAAMQAAALPQGVQHEAYGEMLQTLRAGLAQGDSAVAQEMLATSIGAQWAESHSLYDRDTRATVAKRISDALGDEADAATIESILNRAAEKAAGPARLPEELSPEVYNRLLGMLRRGLQEGDADTQAALAATLQRNWQQHGLPQDPAAVATVQQHLGESLAAQGFAPQQVAQVFADAGLQTEAPAMVVKAVLSQDGDAPADAATLKAQAPAGGAEFVDVTADGDSFVDTAAEHEVVDASFVDIPPQDAGAQGEDAGGFIDTATVPGDHPELDDAQIVDMPVSFNHTPASSKPSASVSGAISLSDLNSILAGMPRRANPAERLSQELASLAQHPGLDNAIHAEKSVESNRAGFLRAVDQFDTLSQLADKTESPELIDDLIDAVYDIEDSIDSDAAPPWVWRLLDSIEQLLLTHKQEGTPVSLSCAAVLRQSANLIENYEEEANEDDAIEAINALMNSRRELGGGKPGSTPGAMPYSGDPLGSELVEDPNANTMLAETFIDEAMSLFAHSQEEAERWDENRSQLSRLDSIRRDMHTLKGSARMAGYNAIGDLTHGVESLIDGIVNGQAEPSSKATSLLVGAMWQGMLMLDSVRDGYLPQTDPYILNNIHSYLDQPLPYPEVAEAAEAARLAQLQEAREAEQRAAEPPVVEPSVEEVPIVTDFDDNIDPVLVDIFTDEAQELLQTTSQLLEDDFSKKEVVEELQRTMHTLKGGARLVGFTAIGDTAHLMESVIDKVPELAEGKVRQAKTLLHFGLDAHYDMLDSVLRHEMPQPALEVNESLKTFADSGVYRPPSQKAGDNAEPAPDSSEQPQEAQSEAPQTAPAEAPAASDTDSSAASTAPAAPATAPSASTAPAASAAAPATDSAAHSTHAQHAESAASAAPADSPAPAAKTAEPPVAPPPAPPEKDKGFDGKPEGVESVIEYGNDQPEKKDEKKPEAKKDDKDGNADNLPRYVRVDAQLLDEMIAMTGETAIMRSRMENVISEAEFNLNELTRVATRIAEQMRRLDSETEAQMLYRREQQGEDDTHFDPLEMDRFSEIQQLSRQLSEAIDDLKNLQDTLSQDNIILRNLSTQQGIIQRSIQDHLLTTQLMRFDVHEARLRRLVKQTAKSVGKDVNFILEGGEVEVERRLLEDILPALEHMIRNSLAHGIEKPEARLATGKPETGTIKLVVSVHAAELSVDLIDDGQGLNYDRIREKAAAKGLLDPERANDEAYLSTLILRSGFSTAESLSQLAGRGVGMDVVNEMVKQRRGQIGVYSLRGKGTQFTLSMPFSMSIAEVLLVEIAGQTFAAPMSSIAAISQVDRDSLQRSFDGETVYQHYNDQDYRQYILGAYFKPEQYSFAVEEQSAPVLFINAGGEPVAFHVDRIQNRLEIIVKNVNRQVLNIPGISGATILGDGRVVPVLELLDLSRRIAGLTPIHDEVAAAEEARIPNVLVVDDSVTMRKVSTRLLERHHYNVATAKDGLDAIEVLAGFTPDIILLDIEMPRMDGFEFASHVRNNSNVRDVPIVMITSRTGDKHRERADAIGVQGYLGKPYSEEVLIQTLEHLLKRRGELS